MTNQRLLTFPYFSAQRRVLSRLPALRIAAKKIRVTYHIFVNDFHHSLVFFIITTAEKYTADIVMVEIYHLITGDSFRIKNTTIIKEVLFTTICYIDSSRHDHNLFDAAFQINDAAKGEVIDVFHD